MNVFEDLLDSLTIPILFADTDHVVRYLNRAARQYYPEGAHLLGRSLLDCHNRVSRRSIETIVQRMHDGLEEELISDTEKKRIYMRAVRDVKGRLIGYYERFEPPRDKSVMRSS